MKTYISFDWARQGIEILVFLADTGKSVIVPVVREMVINLVNQTLWKRLVICESSQQSHPVVEFCTLVYCSHFLVIVGDDLNERTHNVWEEGDTAKHDKDSKDHLYLSLRCKVSISYCGQCCQCEVAAYDKSVVVLSGLNEIGVDKTVFVISICV